MALTQTLPSQAIVLVVEDEPVQRMMLCDLVQDAGFGVLEAWDASSAVAILEQRGDVRLLLTDIEMPGSVDGLKLASAVRDRWPPIEIVVITAGPPPDPESLPPRAVFLPKPIRTDDMVGTLQRMAAETQADER